MTAPTFTGSRWAILPQTTPVRDRHDCDPDRCRTCQADIADAEDARMFGDPDRGWDMDDRAEREAWG